MTAPTTTRTYAIRGKVTRDTNRRELAEALPIVARVRRSAPARPPRGGSAGMSLTEHDLRVLAANPDVITRVAAALSPLLDRAVADRQAAEVTAVVVTALLAVDRA